MPKPYSIDLRGRVIEDVETGASRREAAERYGLSPSVVVIWVQRFEETGNVAAKPSGGTSPLEKHAEFLLALIADKPDMTLDEIVVAMRKRRIAGSRSAVWRLFARRNISFKKTLYAVEQKRADVARACRRWKRDQGMFDPARLVFIDETSTNTAMVRLRGRVLRVASGWSTTRRMELGKQLPSWAACDNAE
jgi:transposase